MIGGNTKFKIGGIGVVIFILIPLVLLIVVSINIGGDENKSFIITDNKSWQETTFFWIITTWLVLFALRLLGVCFKVKRN